MDFEDREIREELHRLYWEKNYSLRQISKELEIPRSSLHVLFIKLGLRTRSRKQAQKLDWRRRKDVYKKI